ncbi:hypothetical protein [Pararhizobium qamdonense]|uniref:hypothetical protein n=1 Tax=Pararhizobium qamdonense TaxID=3031126 RepID=UPI0023E2DE11|nr:hypothetical protein [Pararhizobium qamdonense]
METRALFRKTEASMNELAANAGFTLLALRGALAEAEAEHLQAREAVNWQDRASVQAAKHAFERVSAISLAVQDVSGIVTAAQSALRSLDLRSTEWEVYVGRNEIAA